jgi:CopG antitoxin of type II toxin-antitoxin system
METAMIKAQLPQTDSISELAQFWDTHDLTDFEADLEEVTEPVFVRENFVTVPLPSGDAESLHRIAKSMGLTDAELIQQWVREKIEMK